MAWINKRFKRIENEIKELEFVINDKNNTSNAALLERTMSKTSILEEEYLTLIREKDELEIPVSQITFLLFSYEKH